MTNICRQRVQEFFLQNYIFLPSKSFSKGQHAQSYFNYIIFQCDCTHRYERNVF